MRCFIIMRTKIKEDLIGLYQAGVDRGYEEARKEALDTIIDTRVQAELEGYKRGMKDKSFEDWNKGFDEGWEDGHNAGRDEVFSAVTKILETTMNEQELIEALYKMME